jgi:hypothetical protein
MEKPLMEHGQSLSTLWTTFRDRFRARRAARASVNALDHQLASYTTPAELDDLAALVELVERAEDVELADYRRIIEERRVAAWSAVDILQVGRLAALPRL